jgi:hypothetical protein
MCFASSAPIVIVLVLGWGIEAGLPGWKRDEWRKQAPEGALGSPEKRTRTKDDDDWDMAPNTYQDLPWVAQGKPWAKLSCPFRAGLSGRMTGHATRGCSVRIENGF